MNRLPDRPESGNTVTPKTTEETKKKKGFKENLGMYMALMVIVAVIYVITQKVQVPYDHMTITDYTPQESSKGFFVVGELQEGQKFAGANVDLNEETGIAEITVYQYHLPSVFGSQEFVVMIGAPEEDVKEIWLRYTDSETRETERTQLDFKHTKEAES